MSDDIRNLPTNEYHIPNENEINILNTLFAPPKIPTKLFLKNTIYISVLATLLNLIYFKFLSNHISKLTYIFLSFIILCASIYYIQVLNYQP